MSRPVKGSTPTMMHTAAAANAQRLRAVTSIPIRTDLTRQNRPNSRGTPSRASNSSRGARVSDDRYGRSFDDADDHLHWLSIPAIEGDAQSFQSLTLDSSQRREMASLIERQRINARLSRDATVPSNDLGISPAAVAHELGTPHVSQQHILHLDRQITTSTEGLSDITFESDDGFGSDRTTTAFYMADKGSPTKEGAAVKTMVRHMTDDELTYLENYLKIEKQRRQQQIDAQAVEARKQMRRSKSGGSEAAFTRKHSVSPGMGGARGSEGQQEPEDPEVLSLFLSSGEQGAVLSTSQTQQSPYLRSGSFSRGSGAVHPGDKMFDPKLFVAGSTPSPATTNAASNSHANSAIHFMASPNVQSPEQQVYHSSRPGSRPASGGLASLLNAPTSHSTSAVNDHNQQQSTHNSSANTPVVKQQQAAVASTSTAAKTTAVPLSIAPVTASFSSINEREEEALALHKAKKLTGGGITHRSTTSREFVFSPSCAFDDCSLGSQKSINSSRSSRTRLMGEAGVGDLSSPGSTFSKHHNSNVPVVAVTAAVKKTVYAASSEPKKSKKN